MIGTSHSHTSISENNEEANTKQINKSLIAVGEGRGNKSETPGEHKNTVMKVMAMRCLPSVLNLKFVQSRRFSNTSLLHFIVFVVEWMSLS